MNAPPTPVIKPLGQWLTVALCALALLVPMAIWGLAGHALPWIGSESSPPGQWLYVVSKFAALYAIALIGLQFLLLVLRTRKLIHPRVNSRSAHRLLGMLTLGVLAIHVFAFVAAAGSRSGHLTLHLFLPLQGGGFYNTLVSLGALALWLAIAGALLQFSVARRVRFNRIHPYLMTSAAVVAIIHSYGIGSESGMDVMLLFYGMLVLLVLGYWTNRYR